MRRILETRMRTEFQADGGAVKVVADFTSREGNYLNYLKLRGNVSAPNQTTGESAFQQTAPGRYEGKFTPAQRGIHFVTLYADGKYADGKPGEALVPVATVPYIAPYPKEYRELKPNVAFLSRLAEETGGEMLDAERLEEGVKRLYTVTPGKGTRGRETWWPLAGFSLFLFLADLVLRSWPRKGAEV
jgi:hypothetical protein